VNLSSERIRERLASTAGWLADAQDSQPDGGVSGGYYFYSGWRASYPETTGYIMRTLIDYSRVTNRADVVDRVQRMCRFLLNRQEPGAGWFSGGDLSAPRVASVFNSGMILHGLAHHYTQFRDGGVLEAARRCADWICSRQEDDGAWGRDNYHGLKRTYDTEVAASIAEVYAITKDERHRRSAERSADWALAQQLPNGWYQNCDNTEERNDRPLTHLIGYTTRGLIVCGRILGHDRYMESAVRCLEAIMDRYPIHSGRMIDGRLDRDWNPRMGAACQTGTAQIAISLFLLNEWRPTPAFVDYARWLNSFLAQTQLVHAKRPGARGGIPASFPIWGAYERFGFNNWGQKYYMDSLMLDLASRETKAPETKLGR
jgi:hypothetical protein